MDKRTAIRECKNLWKEIDESGLSKDDFLYTTEGEKWLDKRYLSACPLCEYVISSKEGDCDACPLCEQFDMTCFSLGFHHTEKHSRDFLRAVRNLRVHGGKK